MFKDGSARCLCLGTAWCAVALIVATVVGSAAALELTEVEINLFNPSAPSDIADVAGQVVAAASIGSRRELHFVDPAAPEDGSMEVEVAPGPENSNPGGIVDVTGLALFNATVALDNELFIVDPTDLAAGATQVNVSAGGSSSPLNIADVADLAIFSAIDAGDREPYIVDPTAVVPMATKVDVNPGGSSNPGPFTSVAALAIFRATTANGNEPQIVDPTAGMPAATEVDLNAGGSSTPGTGASDRIIAVGNLAVLAAFDGTDTEPFVLDPTLATATKVDIAPGTASSNPFSLASVAGRAVFRATDFVNGNELHILDPLLPGAGTTVVDINETLNQGSNPDFITGVANQAVFAATDAADRELYAVNPLDPTSDPSVWNINPTGSSNPEEITNVDGRAVFRATVGGDEELYIVDPLFPDAGFVKVDVNPTGSSSPTQITDVAGRVAFAARDNFGSQLYVLSFDTVWDKSGSGLWSDAANWKENEVPRFVDNVVITPPNGLTVTGPEEETRVSSLTIGSTGGTATLNVADGTIQTHNVTVNGGGRLAGHGTVVVDVGRIVNMGTLDLTAGLQISGGTLENHGLVNAGVGSVVSTLENQVTGEVRGSALAAIRFAGTGNTNLGEINLLGGTVEFTQDLHNQRDGLDNGLISGRGTLFVQGGLMNDGSMAFSGDTTDIFGDVDNTASGIIVNSGAGVVTFFDDVLNNGEIRTSAGSTSVFFGAVTGGAFPGPNWTGTGTVLFEGDLSPGNSAALVEIENNVVFGPHSSLMIEIGGTQRGADYDALDIGGSVELNGTLQVLLADFGSGTFLPMPGDTFSLVSAGGGIEEDFGTVHLPLLGPDLQWQLHHGVSHLLLDVVIAGDFNADGMVGAADYTLWRDMLGQVGVGLAADGNGDGTIGQEDYEAWKAHFGWSLATFAGPQSNAVPEPATLVMLLMTAISSLTLRRGGF